MRSPIWGGCEAFHANSPAAANAADIRGALRLYRRSCGLLWGLAALLTAIALL